MKTTFSRAALLCVLTVSLLIGLQSLAAETPAATALPDAPSASTTEGGGGPQQPASKSANDEGTTIARRSIFFPGLATSKTPLTVGQKFSLAVTDSVSPPAFIGSAFGAGINQATNSPSGYGQGGEGYGKRFGSLMAMNATNNMAGEFLLASIAREDPRFFISGGGTFGHRLGWAISRVLVARKDRGGQSFNWGGVFGPLVAQVVANAYLPVQEQTGARTAERYAYSLGTSAGLNVLKEFWPDIFKRLRRK